MPRNLRIVSLLRNNLRKWSRVIVSLLFLYGIFKLYIMYRECNSAKIHIDYFQNLDDNNLDFIVDTPNCQIPDLNAWDASIAQYTNTTPRDSDCWGSHKHWTHTTHNDLIINKSAIIESGYSMKSVRCCYKTIQRVEETLEKYTMAADNVVRLSNDCTTLTALVTPMDVEFVRVVCTCNSWPALYGVVYSAFHAFTPANVVSKKMSEWENFNSDQEILKPPNVILLGLDSMSRLHFRRNMKKTVQFIERIGAVEMLGFTKVAENTWPNHVAFLSGYDTENLEKVCHYTGEVEQDSCPYIWKKFSDANYITATIEDVPSLTGFNYFKAGFVEKPTDFYFRPFMLSIFQQAAKMREIWDEYNIECIGSKSPEETILNYIGDILKLAIGGPPAFIHTWMTSLAHDIGNMNRPKTADTTFENFLLTTDLNNTILFILSDHGFRFGGMRETFVGWYEEKMPALWIYIPEELRTRFPNWIYSLKLNSKSLTTPFDLYHTMNEILSSFTNISVFADANSRDGTKVPRVYGQSLFKLLSENRSCKEAGVGINYCACSVPKSVNHTLLKSAAETSINYLNAVMPPQCARFILQSITAGALMSDPSSPDTSIIIVTFLTAPGLFLFEANVVFDSLRGNYSINTDLLRMNQINTDISCVNTSLLHRYCYCL